MLTIRLQRTGKTKHPLYRLIISEKARDTQDRFLEVLGTYNPHDKQTGVKLETERINYWLSKGAQTSNTIHNLFVKNGIVKGDKKKSVYLTDRRKKKLDEKKKATAPKEETKAEAPAPSAESEPKVDAPVPTVMEAPAAETPAQA